MGLRMQLRHVFAVAGFSLALPAYAGDVLQPLEAKQFVAGKLFAYTCFEGTTGAGRINADGSVIGTIRIRGSGPVRHVALPPGTIKVSEMAVCAAVRGVPIQPCFDVQRNDTHSFRGSISGVGFAYCDFRRQHPRLHFASQSDDAAQSKNVERPRTLTPPHPPAVRSAEASYGGEPARRLQLRPSTSE